MKYKVGNRVKVQSLERYNKYKNRYGDINYGCETEILFTSEMSSFCGQVVTITRVRYIGCVRFYHVAEDKGVHLWVGGMFEGLVEEENNYLTETVVDTVRESNDRYRIVIDPRFDIEVDEGEYYVVRRKKEYPKSYEECCDIIGGLADYVWGGYKQDLFQTFHMLYICRDAYWKIAGETMGLGKPWEPDWTNEEWPDMAYISYDGKSIDKENGFPCCNMILIFPTDEMRNAFYENFKKEIEICKELL